MAAAADPQPLAGSHPFEAWSEHTFAFQSISNACLGNNSP